MKLKWMLAVILTVAVLMTACGKDKDGDLVGNGDPTPTREGTNTTPEATKPAVSTPAITSATDAVSTASIVSEASEFKKAIGENGTWIICALNDLSFEEELVLDGEFKNGRQDEAGKDILQRKIALYTQDADKNITERYVLTTPSLTINSPQASIQHGKLIGDLYVNTENFQLVDTTVDGNVYFKDDQVKSSFAMDADSKINGSQEIGKQ